MPEIKILLSGALGRLGRAVRDAASNTSETETVCKVIAGIDISPAAESIPIFHSPTDIPNDLEIDCIIDCSHHTAIAPLLDFAVSRKIPTVICTTGHTPDETALIRGASEKIPIFHSRNMSVGINLMIQLAKKAASILGEDFDIEIIEKHHNKKLDAPSGTALMLADAVSESLPYSPDYIYERQSKHEPRRKSEIGIHSIRGGTIVGEHEIIFAGIDETITISHSASSREVFALGALRAAKYLSGKPTGFYNMETLVGSTVEDARA